MDILKQFEGKINGTLETFHRIIMNGYIQPLHSFRLFLYYLIQKNVLLKDLEYAKEIVLKENCYKMMLLTGSKNPNTLGFYRNAGYNSEDKTAFIQWL